MTERTEEQKANLRAGIIAASEQALRGAGRKRRSNKNPLYKPNPQADGATRVVSLCSSLVSVDDEYRPNYILRGFHDEGSKARGIDTIARAHEFLRKLLEASK